MYRCLLQYPQIALGLQQASRVTPEMCGAIRSSRVNTSTQKCLFLHDAGAVYEVKILIFKGSLEDALRKVLAQRGALK